MTRRMQVCALGIAWMMANALLAADAPLVPGNPGGGGAKPLPLLLPPPQSELPDASRVRQLMLQQVAQLKSRQGSAAPAFVKTFPEAFQGPEQAGVLMAWMLMRPDGSVFRSRKILLPGELLKGNTQILWQPFHINNSFQSRETWVRGTPLAEGKTLRVDVTLEYMYMPADYDETRSELRVEEAVLAKHPDMPRAWDNTTYGWLRVVMNEDGTIARERYETLQIADQTYAGWTKVGPQAYERFADQFVELGVDAGQLGVMDQMGVSVLPDGTPGNSPSVHAISRDASSRDISSAIRNIFDTRSMLVTYVWPRRAGEPVGGISGQGMTPMPRDTPPVDPEIAAAIVARYFPDAFAPPNKPADNQPWIVLSHQGEVVRTGRAPRAKATLVQPSGETVPMHGGIDSRPIRDAMPEAKIQQTLSTSVKNQSGETDVTLVWLEADSPLPASK